MAPVSIMCNVLRMLIFVRVDNRVGQICMSSVKMYGRGGCVLRAVGVGVGGYVWGDILWLCKNVEVMGECVRRAVDSVCYCVRIPVPFQFQF